MSRNFIGYNLEQFPTSDNNFTAIVSKTTCTKDGSCYQDFGVANRKMMNTTDPDILINRARSEALNNLNKLCEDISQHDNHQTRSGNKNHKNYSDRSSYSNDKSHRNGGGSKRASDAQKNFLRKLADQKDINLKSFAAEYHCNIEELNGSDADKLIRKIKDINRLF